MATVLTRRFRSCKAHYATVAINDDADITPRPPAKLYRLLVFDRPSPVVGCTLGDAAGACSQISIIPSFRRAHQLARGSAGEWDMGNDSSVDAYSAAECKYLFQPLSKSRHGGQECCSPPSLEAGSSPPVDRPRAMQ